MRAGQRVDYHFQHWALPGDAANELMDRIAEECVVKSTEQTVKNLTKYVDLYIPIYILVPHIEDDKIWCSIYQDC